MSVFTDLAQSKGIEAIEAVEAGVAYDHFCCVHWFVVSDSGADRSIPPDYPFHRATFNNAVAYFTDSKKDCGALLGPSGSKILAAAIIGCPMPHSDGKTRGVFEVNRLWDTIESQLESVKGYKMRNAGIRG